MVELRDSVDEYDSEVEIVDASKKKHRRRGKKKKQSRQSNRRSARSTANMLKKRRPAKKLCNVSTKPSTNHLARARDRASNYTPTNRPNATTNKAIDSLLGRENLEIVDLIDSDVECEARADLQKPSATKTSEW